MKDYEKIAELEKELFYTQEAFNQHTADLRGWDTRMDHEKDKFDSFVEMYDGIVKTKQALLTKLETKISKLKKELGIAEEVQKKNVKKRNRAKIPSKEQSIVELADEVADAIEEEESAEEVLEIPKEEITVEEQINVIKQVKQEINNKVEELMPGKVQCPECKDWFTKGGAFATHYKSHYNGDGN